jgi:hypothetical protein
VGLFAQIHPVRCVSSERDERGAEVRVVTAEDLGCRHRAHLGLPRGPVDSTEVLGAGALAEDATQLAASAAPETFGEAVDEMSVSVHVVRLEHQLHHQHQHFAHVLARPREQRRRSELALEGEHPRAECHDRVAGSGRGGHRASAECAVDLVRGFDGETAHQRVPGIGHGGRLRHERGRLRTIGLDLVGRCHAEGLLDRDTRRRVGRVLTASRDAECHAQTVRVRGALREHDAEMGECLVPVAGPMTQELGEGGARLDPLGGEIDGAAVAQHRAVEILERSRAETSELLVHLREVGALALRGALGERRQRRRGFAPLAEAPQQPRMDERGVDSAGIRFRGDPIQLGRLLAIAALLECDALQVRRRREVAVVPQVARRAIGGLHDVVRSSRRELQLRQREPRRGEARIGGQGAAQVPLGRHLASAAPQLPFGGAVQSRGALHAVPGDARVALQRANARLDPIERLESPGIGFQRLGLPRVVAERGFEVHQGLLAITLVLRAHAEQRAMQRAALVAVRSVEASLEDLLRRAVISQREEGLAEPAERLRIVGVQLERFAEEPGGRLEAPASPRSLGTDPCRPGALRDLEQRRVIPERRDRRLFGLGVLPAQGGQLGAGCLNTRVVRAARGGLAQERQRSGGIVLADLLRGVVEALGRGRVVEVVRSALEGLGAAPQVAGLCAEARERVEHGGARSFDLRGAFGARECCVVAIERLEGQGEAEVVVGPRPGFRGVAPSRERLREGGAISDRVVQRRELRQVHRRERLDLPRAAESLARSLVVVVAFAGEHGHAQPDLASASRVGVAETLDLALVEVEGAAPILHRLEQPLQGPERRKVGSVCLERRCITTARTGGRGEPMPVDIAQCAQHRAAFGGVALGRDLELAFQRLADVTPAPEQLGRAAEAAERLQAFRIGLARAPVRFLCSSEVTQAFLPDARELEPVPSVAADPVESRRETALEFDDVSFGSQQTQARALQAIS